MIVMFVLLPVAIIPEIPFVGCRLRNDGRFVFIFPIESKCRIFQKFLFKFFELFSCIIMCQNDKIFL